MLLRNITKRKAVLIATVIYILLAFSVNFSLLLGANVMKWDIWNAEYPLHVITTDAIRAGTFPVWMPLMDYGTPYYAMLGTPIWYPFTLIFDICGYGPFTPGLEYTLHMIIGAIGMFLLALRIKEKTDSSTCLMDYMLPISMGVFYEFTGIYLSNAEHIMITISMAWIPFVLLYAERYATEKKLNYAMTAGAFASLILLGGYPEMFFDTFLVLIVWMIYWSFSGLKSAVYAVLRLAVIGISTCCFAAISLVPFIRLMSNITRGAGQEVSTYPFPELVSSLLPVTANQLSGNELSMGLFYIGIGAVISLLLAFRCKNRQARAFAIYAVIALYLCFGRNSILHTILYMFVPMYSSFRFATLWRAFFAIFALLAAQAVWLGFADKNNGKWMFRAFAVVTVLAAVLSVVNLVLKFSSSDATDYKSLFFAFALLTAVSGAYCIISLLTDRKKLNYKYLPLALGIVVVLEAVIVATKAFPVYVSRFEATGYYTNEAIKNNIDNEKYVYDNRNKSVEFAGNARSVSGEFNSYPIAMNKTFDEEGYFSAVLSKTDSFKNSKLRDELKDAPMVFMNSKESSVELKHFSFNEISIEVDAKTDDVLTLLQAYYPGWRLYVDGERADIVENYGCFMGAELKAGVHSLELRFVPIDLYVGAAITAITILVYILVLFFSVKRRDEKNA